MKPINVTDYSIVIDKLTDIEIPVNERFKWYCCDLDIDLYKDSIIVDIVDDLYPLWGKYIELFPNLLDKSNNLEYYLKTFDQRRLLGFYRFINNFISVSPKSSIVEIFLNQYAIIMDEFCEGLLFNSIHEYEISEYQTKFINKMSYSVFGNGHKSFKFTEESFRGTGYIPNPIDINLVSSNFILGKDYKIYRRVK